MHIAIIGGAGFIGTRLTKRLLLAGHTVVIGDKVTSITYPELSETCDIREEDSLRSILDGCDAVYNLAAEHHDNVSPNSLYYDVNVEGSKKLIQIVSEKKIKNIIYTSSVAVYGFCDHEGDEDTPFNPFNHYGKSKAQSEKYYTRWAQKEHDRTLTIIRPTAVFGENNRGNIYNLLRQVASGLFLMIGSGMNKKSIAYVENISKCLEWSLTRNTGCHVFNYIDKPDLDMNGLVAVIRETLGESSKHLIKLNYSLALILSYCFKLIEKITRKPMAISPVRVRKFTAETIFSARKFMTQDLFQRLVWLRALKKQLYMNL